MFCRNCGKEIPDNAKFCSGCGTPVSVPAEEPSAAPDEESEVILNAPAEETAAPAGQPAEAAGEQPDELQAALEQPAELAPAAVPQDRAVLPVQPREAGSQPMLGGKKRGSALVIMGIAVVVVIVLIAAVTKLLGGGGGGKEVFVYLNDDDELMFRKDLKVKTQAGEIDDDGAASVFFSKDGKYIYYITGGEYSSTGNLYRAETSKIGNKDFSPEKISTDVNPYYVSVLDNGGVVYLRGSGDSSQMRWYDGKESYKLASGMGYFTVNEKGTYAYYNEYDSSDNTLSVYRVEIKDGGEKERILKDADDVYNSYSDALLLYGKSNGSGEYGITTYDVYSQVPGGDKAKLLSDVFRVLDTTVSGSKVSIVYMTAEVEERTLYDFVKDSMASSDAGAKEPSSSDYQTYNSWGTLTTDWNAYYAAQDEWREVSNRDSIRENLKETYYNLTTYTLHSYQDGKDTVLAEGLDSAYPEYSVPDGIYIYSKADNDIYTVCDVADLGYWGEIYDKMGSAECTWYQSVNGKESKLSLDEDYTLNSLYVLNGSEAVLSVADYERDERALLSYSVGKDGLTFSATVLDEKWTGLSKGSSGKQDALYCFIDMDKEYTYGDLVCYANGTKTTVAKDIAGAILMDGGKTIFVTDDWEYNARRDVYEFSLYLVKDGKNERIADEVSDMVFLDSKRLLYISDGDLYVWNGSTSEKLATDVVSIWASQTADVQGLSV